ncbi:MAG: RadC family protein [Alkalibacterium gilvum]|uniref:DNA repair protein RadC n=1 Tax=Alkalibacterium gilvum TaxID=1130080 RepID=A0A1H6ULF5_9LACT|nr:MULTISPECIES: DNA repair protein RadC [Alkalibacterium]MDN6293223.1 DNA repair protein RadC [Alkalibacterium sp.]MDN6295269.1 DNA repair protein RadC [Alkalibacterium sp.]SEI93128.1 DNA repair protein RadC [Alkalibacterium gilvum]HAJ69740.1 JAB domain-containing protein [Alkalibacterium sp.]
MINQKFVDVPQQSRPRERMAEYGPEALANHELLAILLRTGTKDYNVLQLSMQVFSHFDDLYMFKNASLEELLVIPGIGKAKAFELLASIELGKRLAKTTLLKEGAVTSSQYVGKLLLEELKGLQQELVVGLFLNTKNEIIKKETIFKGSLNTSVAHPREIFKAAMKYSSARIIIAHNHPSGNPEPSEADLQFTKRMVEVGKIVGIELLDHFIIGEDKYISLKEHGAM